MQTKREVTLGEQKYLVLPQSIGYLQNKLGPRLQEVLEADLDGIDGVEALSAKAHGVLAVFIPNLMPLHVFLGYDTEADLQADNYEQETDRSPTVEQVKEAFKAASDVNGGEILGHLKALMGPAITQKLVAWITAVVAERFSTTSAPLPTSPSTSGGSDSTSSSTTDPIPAAPESAD